VPQLYSRNEDKKKNIARKKRQDLAMVGSPLKNGVQEIDPTFLLKIRKKP
jgi:hypothetical protein